MASLVPLPFLKPIDDYLLIAFQLLVLFFSLLTVTKSWMYAILKKLYDSHSSLALSQLSAEVQIYLFTCSNILVQIYLYILVQIYLFTNILVHTKLIYSKHIH